VCVDPVTATMGAGMAMQAAGPVLGAFGEYNQGMAKYRGERAMTKLRNQRAMSDWAYRKQVQDREWQQSLKIYQTKVDQHKLQVEENSNALYRAYKDSQVQMNQIIEGTKQQNFDAWRRLLGMQGQATAAGKVGRRANQQDRLNRLEFGIEQQRRLSDLTKYQAASDDRMEVLTEQANNANMNSWYGVSIAPQPLTPIPNPTLEPYTAIRPSMLGMVGAGVEAAGGLATGIAGLMGTAGTTAKLPGSGQFSPQGIPGMQIPQGNYGSMMSGGFANPSNFGMAGQFANMSPVKSGTMNAFSHLIGGGNPIQGFALGAAGSLLNNWLD